MITSTSLPGPANKALAKRAGNRAPFVCPQPGLRGSLSEGSVHSNFAQTMKGCGGSCADSSSLFMQANLLSASVCRAASTAGSEEVHIINTLCTQNTLPSMLRSCSWGAYSLNFLFSLMVCIPLPAIWFPPSPLMICEQESKSKVPLLTTERLSMIGATLSSHFHPLVMVSLDYGRSHLLDLKHTLGVGLFAECLCKAIAPCQYGWTILEIHPAGPEAGHRRWTAPIIFLAGVLKP